MPTHPTGRQHPFGLNGRFTFFKGFLRRPAVVGSIIPSSRFLERRIVAAAEIAQARTVVELGPGTGGTTQAILNALPPTSRLLTLEIDPGFVSYLRSFPDPRLCVHLGSAERIGETLAEHGLARPDAVVSGIPFSNMPAGPARISSRSSSPPALIMRRSQRLMPAAFTITSRNHSLSIRSGRR